MKILYPFSGVSGIFFPVGKLKDGGTCEYASKKCLSECAALKNSVGEMIIGYPAKEAAFKFISKQPIFDICSKIIKEMEGMSNESERKILYWFASGDCMRNLTTKIGHIIQFLSWKGVVQCGFTRSFALWKSLEDIPNVYMVLTVEKSEKKVKGDGLIATPDYESGKIKIYRNSYSPGEGGSCGGPAGFNRAGVRISANCRECYEKAEGCFWEGVK